MPNSEPLRIQCPKCGRVFRFGRQAPSKYACGSCGAVLDLSGFATSEPAANLASDRRPSAPDRERARRPPTPAPRRPSQAKWVSVLVGIVVTLAWAGKFYRAGRRSGLIDDAPASRPSYDEPPRRSYAPETGRSAEVHVDLTSPKDGSTVDSIYTVLKGVVTSARPTDTVSLKGEVLRSGNGTFSKPFELSPGPNWIEFAISGANGVTTRSFRLECAPAK